MGQADSMHLPGPFRAAVGLVATAAAEVRQLPDRAIELPMLAVSSALQASLRTQQRYARLAARGDDVLNRRRPTSDAPPWATFDEPVPVEDLRRAALAELTRLEPWIADLGVGGDGAASTDDDGATRTDEPAVPPVPAARATPTRTAPAKAATKATTKTATTTAKRTTATKTTTKKAVTKAAPKKAATTKAATTKLATTKAAPTAGVTSPTSETSDPSSRLEGKTVSKPRHTAPSRFDDAGD